MSSEPGNESFFCALRPIPRILSLRRRDETNQVKICKPSAPQDDFGVLMRAGGEWRALPLSTNRLRPISTGVKGQSARASGRQAGGDPVGREVAKPWDDIIGGVPDASSA